MKNSNPIVLLIFAGIVVILVSCVVEPDRKYTEELKHNSPVHQLTADLDMYKSPSIETYGENSNYEDNMSARHPVAGTVPRGFMPYIYPNTNEGYVMAGDSLNNPFANTPDNLAKGKDIYTKFCGHCHGTTGNGDGSIIINTDGKYPPPPSYSTGFSSGGGAMKDLSVGKMFHVITYGRNMMGPHASQLTAEERWKVILYVQTLQKQGDQQPDETGAAVTEGSDEEEASAGEEETTESEENE